MAVTPDSGPPGFGEADLTNCDREPIHIPGSIQPHGAMLVYDSQTMVVTHASQNAGLVLGVNSKEIVGQPLETIIGAQAAQADLDAMDHAGSPTQWLVFERGAA